MSQLKQNCRFLLISHKLLYTIFHHVFYDLPCRHLLNSYLVLIRYTVMSVSCRFHFEGLHSLELGSKSDLGRDQIFWSGADNVELDQKWVFSIECFGPVIFFNQFKIDFDQ